MADAGRDADLVIVATPDAAIADTAAALAPSLRAGALVVHLSGACPLEELDKLHAARPDVEVGCAPPAAVACRRPRSALPTAPGLVVRGRRARRGRTPGAVARPAPVPGRRPVTGPAYHAAATIASNHLVALLGQAARVADAAGVPPEALLPLVRATVDNVDALGPADALTGPVARGDGDTVARHLDALPADERAAYRALAARSAARSAGATIPRCVELARR